MLGSAFDLLGNQSADLTAIDEFFNRENPKTPAAAALKQKWILWYDSLSLWDKNASAAVMQEATNRRNAYNIANTKTEQERDQLRAAMAKAPSREEQQGKPRATDAAGNYPAAKGITMASAAKNTVPKGARPTIRQGTTGDAVTAWQQILKASVAPNIATDGKFGPGTKAATIDYQKKYGLTPDGIVGSATWATALGGKEAQPMAFEQAAVTPVTPVKSKVKPGEVAQTAALKIPPKKVSPAPKPFPEVAKKASIPAKVVTKTTPNVASSLQKEVGVKTVPTPVAHAAGFFEGKGGLIAAAVGAGLVKLFLR